MMHENVAVFLGDDGGFPRDFVARSNLHGWSPQISYFDKGLTAYSMP